MTLTPSSVAIPPCTISPSRAVVSGGIVDLQRLVERRMRYHLRYGEKLTAVDRCVNPEIVPMFRLSVSTIAVSQVDGPSL